MAQAVSGVEHMMITNAISLVRDVLCPLMDNLSIMQTHIAGTTKYQSAETLFPPIPQLNNKSLLSPSTVNYSALQSNIVALTSLGKEASSLYSRLQTTHESVTKSVTEFQLMHWGCSTATSNRSSSSGNNGSSVVVSKECLAMQAIHAAVIDNEQNLYNCGVLNKDWENFRRRVQQCVQNSSHIDEDQLMSLVGILVVDSKHWRFFQDNVFIPLTKFVVAYQKYSQIFDKYSTSLSAIVNVWKDIHLNLLVYGD
jgi:hypothetical protein